MRHNTTIMALGHSTLTNLQRGRTHLRPLCGLATVRCCIYILRKLTYYYIKLCCMDNFRTIILYSLCSNGKWGIVIDKIAFPFEIYKSVSNQIPRIT